MRIFRTRAGLIRTGLYSQASESAQADVGARLKCLVLREQRSHVLCQFIRDAQILGQSRVVLSSVCSVQAYCVCVALRFVAIMNMQLL